MKLLVCCYAPNFACHFTNFKRDMTCQRLDSGSCCKSECRRTCRLLLCKHLAWNSRRYMIIWLCILSKGYTSHPSASSTILSLQLACGLDSHILICVHHSPWSFLGTWRKSWLNSATLQVMCDAISWRWWRAADDVEVRVEGSDRKGSLGDSASLSDLDSKSTFACWILFAGLMVAIHCECSYIRHTCTFFSSVACFDIL